MRACPHCAAELESPLACAACGRLLDVPEATSPFEILGLAPKHALDAGELRKRLLRLGRLVHPDFFGAAGAPERARAERNSALLNRAHELLADEFRRASWLVGALGGPDELQERAMPPAFLAEVLEWNETLEAARSAGAAATPELEALEGTLRTERARTLASVAAALDPLPEHGAERLRTLRSQLNAVRYIDRALSEIEALRLARASVR